MAQPARLSAALLTAAPLHSGARRCPRRLLRRVAGERGTQHAQRTA